MSDAASPEQVRTIIVSGLSGSGKSTAIRALEDIGFFCVDNLPVVLLGQVLALCQRAGIQRMAVVIDARERQFLEGYEAALWSVTDAGHEVETLFLHARHDVLVRRFKETRRRHPLQGDGTIADGIAEEAQALTAIQMKATENIDTSELNVHALRARVQEVFGAQFRRLGVVIESFGFKHGPPAEADFMFDVRFLPNPFFVPGLRELTGVDVRVSDYVLGQPDTPGLLERLESLVTYVLPRIVEDGRSQITLAVGCTGGQHRSVAVTEWLGKKLEEFDTWDVRIRHRDVKDA